MAVTQEGNKVTLFGTVADAITGRIHIQRLIWLKPTTAAHDIVVSDSKGKVVWQKTCDIADTDQELVLERGFWVNGLTLTTIDSGTLMLYKY